MADNFIWVYTIIIWYIMANGYLEILKLLVGSRERYNINQIAKLCKINYKTAYQNIAKLHKNGIVDIDDRGNNKSCSFNNSFNHDVFHVEIIRRTRILKNKNLYVIINDIRRKISSPFFIALLFGSYASGKHDKGSDIDIALIADDEIIVKDVKTVISLIPLDIHLLHFTPNEFLSMIKSKEFSVGIEIFKNNIILHGIENYYELIKNVR